MKKTKNVWRYLFKLPVNIFNNKAPSYEINSLPYSDQSKVIIFAGISDRTEDQGVVYIFLELSKELSQSNNFANLQRLLNLIYMETGLPIHPLTVQINKEDTADQVISKFVSKTFYYPDKSYSGTAPQPNHIARVQSCVSLINKLNKKNFRKFDNALNTYIWALELMELPNPHLKYTLYMTLFLSSIEQLIDMPATCKYIPFPVCKGCGKEFADHHPKGKGIRQAFEDFIREMLTGSGVDDAVKRVNRLHQKLRSSFLHSGTLSGKEKIGGFLFDKVGDTTLIIEDMMNTFVLNRQLLEQFLIKRQSK
jgi:hypothetical protein